MSNDIDHGPLAGWVIAIAHGKNFLGRPEGEFHTRLGPVYELLTAMGPAPNGMMATMRQVLPVLTLSSIRSLDLPPNAIVIPISELNHKERAELSRAVAGCVDIIGAMRANDAGIVVAPAGAMPRGGR